MSAFLKMNAAELFDCVFDVYKKSFFKQVAFAAIVNAILFVAVMILTVVVTVILVMSMIPTAIDAEPHLSMGTLVTIFLVIFAIVLPLMVLWMAVTSSGHIILSRQVFLGEHVKLPLSQMPRTVGRVLSSVIAQAILSLPFFALIVGIVYFGVIRGRGDMSFALTEEFLLTENFALPFNSMVAFIGITLLSTIAYTVYSNIFALSVAVAVNEKQVFFGTIRRSWQLIKGDFWWILGVRLLWTVTVLAFSYSAQGMLALADILMGALGWEQFAPLLAVLALLQPLFSLAVMFLISPLEGIMPALMYFNQRIAKEGIAYDGQTFATPASEETVNADV